MLGNVRGISLPSAQAAGRAAQSCQAVQEIYQYSSLSKTLLDICLYGVKSL